MYLVIPRFSAPLTPIGLCWRLLQAILFVRQILGRHQFGLHSQQERHAHRHHGNCQPLFPTHFSLNFHCFSHLKDPTRLGGGARRVGGAALRLEGRRVPRPGQHSAALSNQSGRGVSSVRHVRHLLRPTCRHLDSLLENFSNRQKQDSQETRPSSKWVHFSFFKNSSLS